MTARRATRTGALAVVLLLLGATAVSVVATRRGAREGASATDAAAPHTRTAEPGRRERAHVAAVPGSGDAAAAAGAQERGAPTGSGQDGATEGPPPSPGADDVLSGTVRQDGPRPGADDDPVLHAEPERDPLRAVDPARVGAPPPMELLALVRTGWDSVDGAAELVGARRPPLERGEPIALTGRVLDADTGRPLAGARVVVTSTFYVRRHLYDHHLREVARAHTDDDGEFAIPRVDVDPAHFGRGGRLYATVTAVGHAPSLARPIAQAAPGATSRLPDVRLATAVHTLSGRLIDEWEGRPIVGATLYATGSIDPVSYPKDQRAALFLGAPSTVTDDTGAFELAGLGAGVQVVSAHGGDDCLGRATFVVPRDDDVTLRMRGIGGRIAGTVVDARGDPVPLVAVQGGGNSTHSFADGSFVLENFREPTLAIVFSHPDYRRVVLRDIADGTANVLVRLEHHQPEVRLRVRRADDGEPLGEIRVIPRAAEGAAVRATSPVHLADEGVHVLRVPEGAVALTVAAAGLRAVEIDLTGVRDGDALDVVLEPD